MASWIESLGYLGAFLGAFMEGELMFLAAIQTARMGYLQYPLVLLAVFMGTQTADWFFFLSGRKQGGRILERRPSWGSKVRRISGLVERRSNWLLLTYRFMYGFRIVLPVLFGLSSISTRKFALFSLLSTTLWVGTFGSLGYFLAELLIQHWPVIQEGLQYFAIALGVAALGYLLWLFSRRDRS